MKKKLFADLITSLLFVAAVIFAGCSNPSSSSSASGSDVPRGSVIAATYSSEGGGTQIVFNEDNTVVFIENSGASAKAAVAFSEDKVCAEGTYVITADNTAQITITEVLHDWGDIKKDELNKYKEGAFTVSFSGNELHITVEEKSLSFSTDKIDVSKPPVQSAPLFSNGPMDATYLLRRKLKLENDNFSFTANITFDGVGGTVSGKYTESDNTIKFNEPTILGGKYTTEATATISGDTLTLTTVDSYSDGSSDKDVLYFKKSGSSGKEWELKQEVKLSSNKDIKYYENGSVCWEGVYTIIDDEKASVNVKSGSIKDIFGTDQGNLYVELFIENEKEYLSLDFYDLDGRGGISNFFARDK